MIRRPILSLLLVLVTPVLAGAELLLDGGKVLTGKSVERKGALYLLEIEADQIIGVPVELVRRVRLTGDDAPPATGIKPAEPETLAGRPDAEHLPSASEQRRVLEDSVAVSRPGPIDPWWYPTSDWDLNPEQANNFRPTRWSQAPLDPSWTARSDYNANTDATEFNPVRWYVAPIDPIWWPTDGFRPPLRP